MGGRPINHVKDLLPNGYYVALGIAERFRDAPYREHGVHEDFVRAHFRPVIPKRIFRAPPRDVRQYPISNLLQMSDTSLVNHGFLPLGKRPVQITQSPPDGVIQHDDVEESQIFITGQSSRVKSHHSNVQSQEDHAIVEDVEDVEDVEERNKQVPVWNVADWWIDWLVELFIDRLIDWLIDWMIDRMNDWLIDWLIVVNTGKDSNFRVFLFLVDDELTKNFENQCLQVLSLLRWFSCTNEEDFHLC